MKRERLVWWYGQRESHGFRSWLHVGAFRLAVEAYWWASFVSWGLSVDSGGDGDNAATLGLYLFPFNLYISFTPPFRWRKGWKHRETSLRFDGDRIRLSLGADPWCSPPPHGWEGSWSTRDFLLGPNIYREDPNPRHFDLIPVVMPERTYRWHGSINRDSWKRARWFRHTISRAHLDAYPGEQIPFPGKGENSWDCGEDASHGITWQCETSTEAAEKIRESVMRSRTRYGSGGSWRPAVSAPHPSGKEE